MRIGIDLGGTKIEGVGLGESGQVLARVRVPTPAGDYPATLAAIVKLVAALESKAGQIGRVGLAIPGALEPISGQVKNANSVCLNGQPLRDDLAQALRREVRLANDADCFALSEATDGAGAGATVVFGVIVGTGTGGGVVVNGRLLSGPNAIAGEWGHNPLPWPRADELPGPVCYCGKHGCIETFLSGPGLAADFVRAGGRQLDAAAIGLLARRREPEALACVARYVDRMARSLAAVINLLDPDVIVLGGGLSQLDILYEAVPARWGRYVFSATGSAGDDEPVRTRLLAPRFGDASGVRGAAWLWD
ncbi:MAG: ROK family protein [Gammaproteobacteria bacterium]|nr:ROK family protein [Gammaproteobacteria bacterium]